MPGLIQCAVGCHVPTPHNAFHWAHQSTCVKRRSIEAEARAILASHGRAPADKCLVGLVANQIRVKG